MSKYIDAEKLKAEIEGIRWFPQISSGYNDGREDMKIMVLDIITSLQQEQPEVDLEKEIEKEWETLEKDYSPSALDKSHIIVSGLVGRKQFSRIAHHFYELCKNSK